jgi:asparagine synthase (glutamine-hydrolysing)
MCGIAGIFGLENVPDAKVLTEKMLLKMQHRGPDAGGVWCGTNTVLGHRRLSIIDLSDHANQPFHSNDGRYSIVFNGEIYNYQSIKNQLKEDYNFKTDSDTEVILAAFSKWGIKCLQWFNGMFAFALWDVQEEKLWIARDRMGIKPLYYTVHDQAVIFASEIRSILETGFVERKLSKTALVEYLRYQTVHAPNTLIKDIKLLEPATYLELSNTEIKEQAYWKPWQKTHFDQDPIKIQKNIREKLTAAVDRRLVADVPLGAFLSGGIDSSLIVGIMSERLGKKVDTFNVSFDESEFSEAKYAAQVAKKYQTNHHEIKLRPDDFLASLPQALDAVDHPSGDGPNTWIVSNETKKQGITVALSGLGGDELFAGYDVFKRIPYIADRNWILSFPKPLRSLVGTLLLMSRRDMASAKTKEILTLDYFDLQHLYPSFRTIFTDKQLKKLLFDGRITSNEVQKYVQELEQFLEFETLPTLSRIGVSEMGTYMQHVLLRDTDQMSMAHALEVRVPFLDHELIEYVMHVPDSVKFPHTPKKLLTDSFADLLPSEIVDRKKMGFVLPWDVWMKKDLKAFCEERLNILKKHEAFSAVGIDNLWNAFLSGSKVATWSRVWPLVSLADWMDKNEIS